MKKILSAIAMLLSVVIAFASISIVNVSAYEKGDANRDNTIDQKDVLWIRKYLAKQEVSGNANYADFNGDGVVNTKDVFYLRRWIATGQLPGEGGGDDPTTETQPSSGSENTTNPDLPDGVDPYYYGGLARLKTINDCPYYTVAVNQIGYSTEGVKKVKLIEGKANAPVTSKSLISQRVCYVVDEETNAVVAEFTSGRRSEFTKKLFGTEALYQSTLDITELKTPGTYRLYTPMGYSYPFVVSDNPYEKVTDDMVMALYYQRCGGAITEETLQKYDDYLYEKYPETYLSTYGEKGSYFNTYKYHARPACHYESTGSNKGQEVVVVDTYDSSLGTFVGNTDSSGNLITLPASDFAYGLHDAGDYGRYTQPASQVVCDLLYAYELMPDAFTLDVVQDENGKGEKDNLPDILDHARWEAKFLLNMQSKSGITEGGFYFKICTELFASAQGATPAEDYCFNGKKGSYTGLRAMHVNFAATSYAASALAACYNVFKDKDPEFANECLEAAKKGYKFYMAAKVNKTSSMPDAEVSLRDIQGEKASKSPWKTGGGAYGGDAAEAKDSMWHLSTALYRATGESIYSTFMNSNTTDQNRFSTTMSTHNGGGYGTIACLLMNKNNERTLSDEIISGCQSAFKGSADAVTSTVNGSQMYNSVGTGTYGWGSNARMADALKPATVMSCFDSEKANSYITAARLNFNYILGANPEGYCFVTGQSEGSSKNIHHWPSAILKNRYKTLCVPGLLAGGYTEEQAAAISEDKGKFRYRDDQSDFVANEICVYWNSAAVFAFAAIVQQDAQLAAAKG